MNKYFAADTSEILIDVLSKKADLWMRSIITSDYLKKCRESWMAYHGIYYAETSGGHEIVFGGDQGELLQIAVNHYRNFGEHMITMTTANRPSYQARAVNSDYKSITQAQLANGILDYYMREKRLERYLKTAVEHAVVTGSGYIKMAWNATVGEIYDTDPDTDEPIYSGDIEFTNLSVFDVIYDHTKSGPTDHEWALSRTFKNKFALAAKYPKLADKITALKSKSEASTARTRFSLSHFDDTDDVPVYEFFHTKNEALPQGRYVIYLDRDVILYDGPIPYRTLPIYKISPSTILGTTFGYTPMFDLLPLQEALNAMISAVVTNNHTFAVQNIFIPKGAEISISNLEGGLNIVEGTVKPEPLNLTSSSPEIFKLIDMLIGSMETISGINSVARGNPEANLKSGNALALVQSLALQFMNGLTQSYVALAEDVGTGLINILKDFGNTPRIVSLVGVSNAPKTEEFTGNDLSNINRVIVDLGNPLARTVSGRVEMASNLLQYGETITAAQYVNVINTGNLDIATDDSQSSISLMVSENESLLTGGNVIVSPLDKHAEHIDFHNRVLNDPELRMDVSLVKRVMDHVFDHVEHWKNTDPVILMASGQQPIPASPPPQVPAEMAQMQESPQPGPEGIMMDETNKMQGPGLPENGQSLPSLPKPPKPFENQPVLNQG